MTHKTTNSTQCSTINKKALTKNCHWNGTAGGLSSSDESRTRSLDAYLSKLRTTVETITINSNSKYKLTQKIIDFLWLNLFYFSAFLLGFQKLEEQANISFSFRQRLFVFLFLDKLVNGFLQSGKAKDFSFSHYLASSGNFLDIFPSQKSKRFDYNFWQSCQNKHKATENTVAFGECAVIGRNVLLTRGKAVSFFWLV